MSIGNPCWYTDELQLVFVGNIEIIIGIIAVIIEYFLDICINPNTSYFHIESPQTNHSDKNSNVLILKMNYHSYCWNYE